MPPKGPHLNLQGTILFAFVTQASIVTGLLWLVEGNTPPVLTFLALLFSLLANFVDQHRAARRRRARRGLAGRAPGRRRRRGGGARARGGRPPAAPAVARAP
uniref:Uncharacterized protein n=1 Tax=Arundo donax TaxID=35708 RepID=A0A0A9RZZ7_ARUDO